MLYSLINALWRQQYRKDLNMNKLLLIALVFVLSLTQADAKGDRDCVNTGNFDAWVERVMDEEAEAGISDETLELAFDDVIFDKKVYGFDRKQNVFAQTFLKFSGRMVANYRLVKGKKLLKKHKSIFDKIEKKYGVPGWAISSFWGLETDFGAVMGKMSTIQSLATLAYDCRRPELFRPQLHSALEILESGDLELDEMTGAWAGELGQFQFLPSDYIENGVDFDGDGIVHLKDSTPDALASAAKLLQEFGWQRNQPLIVEVKLPDSLPWEEADLNITHPISQWTSWGVSKRDGSALTHSTLKGSLLLPMGRFGPAFMAYPNFKAYLTWNKSGVYSTTAAYFATRLAGAPKMSPGKQKVNALGLEGTKEVQLLLTKKGYDVGKADGMIGAKTKAAVRAEQLKMKIPADGYPTVEFLNLIK